ncbi:uncharacterized protein LOC131153138 isoform X7 [Malania oleifera]|uniref:uncharacterized protein LOC131153138 isoform X7 n=1 Tax=Malania oleifera TaxID=397392 RepID=UPI0025AE6EAA|nr:uncharacterized protein LOC131153138 isoform X7 [Malania oleifera]
MEEVHKRLDECDGKEKETDRRTSSYLSIDILGMIMEQIHLSDQIHVRAVCSGWRRVQFSQVIPVLLAAQDMGQAEQLRKSGILYLVRRLSIGRRNVHGLNQGSQHFHLLKGKILPLSLPYPVAQENNNLSPQSLIRHLDSLSLLLNLSFP